jgi:lipoic acid synthetase
VRPSARYGRSLELLRRVHESGAGILSKSGLMLGLGETDEEVERTLGDLRAQGCDLLTIGQYLRPTPGHLPVVEYVHPDRFERWRRRAAELGFLSAASGPLVRSSFHADELAGAARSGESDRSPR